MIKFIKTTDGFYYNSGKKWTDADGEQHECYSIDEFGDHFMVNEDTGTIKINKEDVMICKYDGKESAESRGNR